MATYGRYARVCESLACFLWQDWPNRHLWILNNHPVPLHFDHPLVTVLNEGGAHPTLGHARNRLLEFADGEFVRTHDDDDLWMPWAFSQGVERIGAAAAWKPTRSWWFDGYTQKDAPLDQLRFELAANVMEASVTWRTDFVRRVGYFNGEGEEHKSLFEALGQAGVGQHEMDSWAGYCYRWGCGEWHVSGTIGNGKSAEERAEDWKRHNTDVRPNTPLVPAFDTVREWYRRMARCVEPPLQTAWMTAALGLGPAYVPPLGHNSKWLPLESALDIAGRLVVAPGCFDLCTSGHAHMLEWARRQGDALVVLVNDDAGVRVQKGSDRPLVPLAGRIAALSALPCVDAVLVIEGQDDRPLLDSLRPSVLVKGPDYRGREAMVPCPAGCELRIAPDNSFSCHTSDLISRSQCRT
jgi:rfaE bifunctional protein nucleotidyltransferase chain/domain